MAINRKPKVGGWFIMQKLSKNFDFCACLNKKVVKGDSRKCLA